MIRFSALLVATLISFLTSSLSGKAECINIYGLPAATIQSGVKLQIDIGFNLLYSLRFAEARRQFADWQQAHPLDPLGYIATAASYLFEEFYEQKALTSDFFLDDKRLLGGVQGKPDKDRMQNFETINQKGKELAQKQLASIPMEGTRPNTLQSSHNPGARLELNSKL
jgi:hypothetical protein